VCLLPRKPRNSIINWLFHEYVAIFQICDCFMAEFCSHFFHSGLNLWLLADVVAQQYRKITKYQCLIINFYLLMLLCGMTQPSFSGYFLPSTIIQSGGKCFSWLSKQSKRGLLWYGVGKDEEYFYVTIVWAGVYSLQRNVYVLQE